MDMANTYEQRKVDRFERDGLIVDTCAVTDSAQPYETGISDERYNDGDWVIVELYPTKKAAEAGHARWVRRMTAKNPPGQLEDVSSAETAQLCDAFAGDGAWRTKSKAEEGE